MPKRKILDATKPTKKICLENASNKSKKPSAGHWSMGLLQSLEDPSLIIKETDLATVIKDKYPKAEFHYLVIPKENISSLKSVKTEHLDLLKHLQEVGEDVVESDPNHSSKVFKYGYHSEASMFRLHLHVISDDMNSASVKTKKHWNSFNTPFFLNSQDVINDLELNGKIVLPSREKCKSLLETPLKCHKCEMKPKNMPDLKRHILSHSKAV